MNTLNTFVEEKNKNTLIDIQEALKKLNLTPQQVRNLCRDGKIDAKKIGSSWGVEEKELSRCYSEFSCGSRSRTSAS